MDIMKSYDIVECTSQFYYFLNVHFIVGRREIIFIVFYSLLLQDYDFSCWFFLFSCPLFLF